MARPTGRTQPRGEFFTTKIRGVLAFIPRGKLDLFFLEFIDDLLCAWRLKGKDRDIMEMAELADLIGHPDHHARMWALTIRNAPNDETRELVKKVMGAVMDVFIVLHPKSARTGSEGTASRLLVLALRDKIATLASASWRDRQTLTAELGPVVRDSLALVVLRRYQPEPFELDVEKAVDWALENPKHRTPDMLAVHLTEEILLQAGVVRSAEQIRDDLTSSSGRKTPISQ